MPTFQQSMQPAPAGPSENTLPPQPEGFPRGRGVRRLGGRSLEGLRNRGEVILLLAVAGLLDFWNLSINQWANLYYAAAVRSMSTNWHNFLYVSLDPGGVASVDKPPLALWIEALSVRVFGYHPLSILIPEAVMGVATVVLLYDLVRRLFGRIAGFTAAIALATTPITVAMSRHNNTDALLVLCCVAALWFFVRALEEDRTLWIILSGVMVGLGFETKMLIALVVVPGMVVAWLWLRPGGWKRALDQLAASGIAMLAIGSAWPLAVQLTPVANRPWISGTGNNNILTLIFGYNGLGRVAGEKGGPATAEIAIGRSGTGGVYAGATGPFRLLNYALGGQEGWLLGASLAALIIIGFSTRFRRSDPRSGWLIAVGISFLATAAVFSSAAGIFHPYYVSLLAPFTVALVGAVVGGLVTGRLGPPISAALVVAASVTTEIVVLDDFHHQLVWVEPMLLGVCGAACLVLIATSDPRFRAAALPLAFAALLVAPSIWAIDTLGYPTQTTFPAGGPAKDNPAAPAHRVEIRGGGFRVVAAGGGAPSGAFEIPLSGVTAADNVPDDPAMLSIIKFVKAHGGGTIAVSSQSEAAIAIIQQDYDVAGIGGFSGRESTPTVAWFAGEVLSGRVRWVYNEGVENFGSVADHRPGATRVLRAVATVCPQVDPQTDALFPRDSFHLSQIDYVRGLFDCQGEGSQLDALAAQSSA